MAYANNDGIQIYYEVQGDGPPLLLHHGFSDSLEGWREYGYVGALADKHRLILVDGRGHGRSDKPYLPKAYGMQPRAADMVSVLDDLGIEKVNYFGYSLGGWVGFCLAMHAPERIASFVLGGIHPYGQSMELFRTTLQDGIPGLERLIRRLADPYLPDMQRFRQNDVRALYAAVANDRPDISDLLPEMRMPCLLLAGTSDPLHPLVERCSGDLSDSRFVSVPDLNHFQTLMRSDQILPPVSQFLTTANITS